MQDAASGKKITGRKERVGFHYYPTGTIGQGARNVRISGLSAKSSIRRPHFLLFSVSPGPALLRLLEAAPLPLEGTFHPDPAKSSLLTIATLARKLNRRFRSQPLRLTGSPFHYSGSTR